ncbi:MAG: hypothetical protein K2M82_03235, partial [Lachnospiraceae bacterium]|nr:hypothetical protein [Lachnospiraceae bacterium]
YSLGQAFLKACRIPGRAFGEFTGKALNIIECFVCKVNLWSMKNRLRSNFRPKAAVLFVLRQQRA